MRRLAITWVNHAGASLVKVVPWSRRLEASSIGVGFSPVSDAFRADGVIAPGHRFTRPDGDLRLHAIADLSAALDPDQGWAWAPGERRWRDGRSYEADQRSFCRRQQEQLVGLGVDLLAGFELEWVVARSDDCSALCAEGVQPAFAGGPYGADRLVEGLDYATALLDGLDAAGIAWLQFHPEYGSSQFELSLSPGSALAAADCSVQARLVIQRVTRRFGLRCSFSPKWDVMQAGNGGHLHVSLSRHGVALLQGGEGPGGLMPDGEQVVAGLLEALPALMPLACPLACSYLRLAPSSWSAPFQVWGVENREAALRLVPLEADHHPAHLELKVADLGANPYLLLGAVQAQIAHALTTQHQRPLPPPVKGDPAFADGPEAPHDRLPQSLPEARTAFAQSIVQRQAMGAVLHDSLLDSIDAEIRRSAGLSAEAVVASTCWWPLVGGVV